MNFETIQATNDANIFTWNMPNSKVFYIKFVFYLNNRTLPFEYDQALHLLEHIIGKGSLSMQNDGAIVNAQTSQTGISFYCSLPSSYAPEVIKKYMSMFFATIYCRGGLDSEAKTVQAEMSRTLLRPKRRLNNLIHSAVLNSFIGSSHAIESLGNINLNTLRNLKDDLMQPHNAVIYFSGDADPYIGDLIANIEHIDRRARGDSILVPAKLNNLQELPDCLTQTSSNSYDLQVQFAWLKPFSKKISQKDYAVSEILNRFLRSNDKESFFSSYRALGLAYDLFTGITNTAIPGMDTFQIFGVAKNGYVDKIVNLFKDKLEYLVLHPDYIESRIEQYRRSLINNRILCYQTPMQIADRGSKLFERDGNPVEDLGQIGTIATEDIVRPAKNILSGAGFSAKVDYK